MLSIKVPFAKFKMLTGLTSFEEFKFRGWYDAAFRLGQETLSAMLNEFAGIRKVSDESLGRDETPRHTSHEI